MAISSGHSFEYFLEAERVPSAMAAAMQTKSKLLICFFTAAMFRYYERMWGFAIRPHPHVKRSHELSSGSLDLDSLRGR